VFIVRLIRDATGRMTGVVERVRTGEKERVTAAEEVGGVLAAMLAREEPAPRQPEGAGRRDSMEKGERSCSR
jgi:hypothetical protein